MFPFMNKNFFKPVLNGYKQLEMKAPNGAVYRYSTNTLDDKTFAEFNEKLEEAVKNNDQTAFESVWNEYTGQNELLPNMDAEFKRIHERIEQFFQETPFFTNRPFSLLNEPVLPMNEPETEDSIDKQIEHYQNKIEELQQKKNMMDSKKRMEQIKAEIEEKKKSIDAKLDEFAKNLDNEEMKKQLTDEMTKLNHEMKELENELEKLS